MTNLSFKSRAFIALVLAGGAAVLGDSFWRWKPVNWAEFLVLLCAAMVASRLRVKMPGVTGTLSVNLPFILVGVAAMTTAEALAVGCLSTLVQCLPRARQKFNWIQGSFNFANMALAVGATRLVYDSTALQSAIHARSLLLAVAAAGFYAVNSFPVAIIMALTERRSMWRMWFAMVQLSYPYYLASAAIAGLVLTASGHIGWQIPLLLLPLMAGMFYSYRRYFSTTAVSESALTQSDQKRPPQSAAAGASQAVS